MRIGHGYDVHRFGGEGPIVLGGVTIPFEYGLIAHSDGDVVLHAVCDAMLGASALGDIGQFFPDDNARYKDISSRELLKIVYEQISNNNWRISNIDITVIAQTPTMAPHILEMRNNIAHDLELDVNQVGLKATTTEKLGYIGRSEGIAVHALVLFA